MLSGTAHISDLTAHLPTITSFSIEEVELANVEITQLQFELVAKHVQSLLPPALHPTLPPLGLWTCWDVADSPWGGFQLVQLRVSCRSGARPRTLLLGAAIDNERAQRVLAEQWGLQATLGVVSITKGYETTQITVRVDQSTTLEAEARDPEPLTATDIQFFATMHPASTPNGERLIQFDPSYEVLAAERYTPKLTNFQAASWGHELVEPSYPVIAWGVNANVHLPKIRFLCRWDVSAFEGTEMVPQ